MFLYVTSCTFSGVVHPYALFFCIHAATACLETTTPTVSRMLCLPARNHPHATAALIPMYGPALCARLPGVALHTARASFSFCTPLGRRFRFARRLGVVLRTVRVQAAGLVGRTVRCSALGRSRCEKRSLGCVPDRLYNGG